MIVGVIYFLVLIVYAIWTYGLTDPNLVISSWPPYWQFQQLLWQLLFHQPQILTATFILLTSLLFTSYFICLRWLEKRPQLKGWWWKYLLIISPLFLAYNALSHDVFNYMFNAKIVLIYGGDPHIQTALNYAGDEWLRFMHNTHTPAPYGYGWTGLSLVPSWFGMGKFVITWLLFRAYSLLSLSLLYAAYYLFQRSSGQTIRLATLAVVFLNPLFLIEIIANQHNDLWMMVPALVSLILVSRKKVGFTQLFLSLTLLGLSISIKLGTLVLLPLWLSMITLHRLKFKPSHYWVRLIDRFWPLIASLLLFIPLLTLRSQQFHPWYLVWVMVWLPIFKLSSTNSGQAHYTTILEKALLRLEKIWPSAVIVLSISSLLRYVPWLLAGGFTSHTLTQQKLITWVPFILIVFWFSWKNRSFWQTT